VPLLKIQVLPDQVISQIAAGEVVERPASVVKELLENALDAQAARVDVRIEQAGQRLIEVADDGNGIPTQEVPLALMRHATSKLRNAQDLFHIQTLGFRGEALASIASVSRLTLISQEKTAEVGARLVCEGGQTTPMEAFGAPIGTLVRVENLFYNVPARLKFLKRDSTERQQIDGLVTRYALAYPRVRFSLSHDGKRVLQTTGSGDRREILANLYGVDTAKQMLEVSLHEMDFGLSGFTSPVALTRSNRREMTFFINGRWVQDSALSSALLQAYHTLLMVGRYPLAILFIEMDPELVDVNVHPAKSEVRFREADRVFSSVQRGFKRALLAYSPVPSITPSVWRTPGARVPGPDWALAGDTSQQLPLPAAAAPIAAPTPADFLEQMPVEADVQPPLVQTSAGIPSSFSPVQGTPTSQPAPTLGGLPLLRLVGQVGNTYLVAEGPDGLYLIDQHAAHERVLFERLMAEHGYQMPAQTLLDPVVFQLPPQSAALLTENLPHLGALGFHVEAFGPSAFRVYAIPALLSGIDPAAAVRVVVEEFEEDETPLQAELEARLAARICKRAAVKGGQSLTPEEQRNLLHDLETCRSPRTCPHGRPTMIHLSVDLLERQFGRRGAR
jgi:DNA mismatch repair protein MutL